MRPVSLPRAPGQPSWPLYLPAHTKLGLDKPTVKRAVDQLVKEGFMRIDKRGDVELSLSKPALERELREKYFRPATGLEEFVRLGPPDHRLLLDSDVLINPKAISVTGRPPARPRAVARPVRHGIPPPRQRAKDFELARPRNADEEPSASRRDRRPQLAPDRPEEEVERADRRGRRPRDRQGKAQSFDQPEEQGRDQLRVSEGLRESLIRWG